MDLAEFRALTKKKQPPGGLSPALQGLIWDAKGDWDKAHECAQAQEDRQGDWVHAYLHRKEGDLANAGYWYRRAKQKVPTGSLDEEWEAIAEALLAEAR
ncbi:MAG: hypothetical protein FJX54_13615 [Alphaproteobacteria bacterium]|nr:hypothetical protein [Alphaproteobacteria bacterium]